MGAKLFHDGGRTAMMELTVAFHNFENGLAKCYFSAKLAETGSAAYSARCSISTRVSFTTFTAPEHKADRSRSSSATVQKEKESAIPAL